MGRRFSRRREVKRRESFCGSSGSVTSWIPDRLKFAGQIKEWTGGRGVDVILNSLSGETLTKSLSVLAPYGRFMEIGKRDIDENHALGLRPFNRNLSFTSIDIDRLIVERPEAASRILREVREHFDRGDFTALPVEVFKAENVRDAFRTLAQAKHIGKVVISMGTKECRWSRPSQSVEVQAGPHLPRYGRTREAWD